MEEETESNFIGLKRWQFKKQMKAYTILGYSGTSYSWGPILNCYFTLRQYEPDALVILVNNFDDPLHPVLQGETNLRYFANKENFWELGAIQTAYEKNPDVDMFFIVQDGITFTNKPVDFQGDIMFWENEFRGAAPDLDIVKKWCENYFPHITQKYNQISNRICHGLMCCVTKETLTAIMEMGLKNIRVTNKAEACASECIMGFLLREYKPSIPFYNEAGPCPTYGYKNDPSKYEFMTKQALGRVSGIGNSVWSSYPTFYADMNYVNTPFSFYAEGIQYSSLADALTKVPESKYHSIFMNYYITNRPALLQLTEKRYSEYSIEGNPYNINSYLMKFIHDLYVLKHWGFYFHPMTTDVKYDTSFLCNWAYHYRDNIHVKYNNMPYIFYKPDLYSEEIQVRSCINEIIISDTYTLTSFQDKKEKVFLDFGANHGVASIILAKQNPESTVYAFEPDPKCYEYLKENIKLNGLTNLKAFHMAVCKQGIHEIELMISPNHSGANTVISTVEKQEKFYQKKVKTCKVKATSLEKIVSENNIQDIELLKIDCEGAEYDILPNSPVLLSGRIKNMVGEFHEIEYLNVQVNSAGALRNYVKPYIPGLFLIH